MRPGSLSTVWRRNPALRLIVSQAALGAGLGLAFALILVAFDVHGLGTLMLGSDSGLVAFGLMAGGFMITFGSLVAGSAIMMMGSGGGSDGPGGGHRQRLVPIPVRSTARRSARR
jgi:hypothetical protein